jgi:hypothetical protein
VAKFVHYAFLLWKIDHLYRSVRFSVRLGDENTYFMLQERGVRQGCPLSPYLFVLVLSAVSEETGLAPCGTKNRRHSITATGVSEGILCG